MKAVDPVNWEAKHHFIFHTSQPLDCEMPRIPSVKRLEAPAAINPGASRRRHRPPPPPPRRLWNAHKRIETGRTQSLQGWCPKSLVESNKWREMVTPDIVEYIDKANPSPEDRYRIVRSPHWFFSRPGNVPVEFRKQVYLYEHGRLYTFRIPLLTDI
jgi:hypothetical protein